MFFWEILSANWFYKQKAACEGIDLYELRGEFLDIRFLLKLSGIHAQIQISTFL